MLGSGPSSIVSARSGALVDTRYRQPGNHLAIRSMSHAGAVQSPAAAATANTPASPSPIRDLRMLMMLVCRSNDLRIRQRLRDDLTPWKRRLERLEPGHGELGTPVTSSQRKLRISRS